MRRVGLQFNMMYYRVGLVILSLLAIAATIVAVIPNFRDGIRRYISKEHRVVLASVRGDLRNNGTLVAVTKVRENGRLFLEFYDVTDESMTLIQKAELADRNEGYFTFMGEATNLALANIDEDGILELLAPTFDDDLIAHLNVFKFNSSTNTFERVTDGPTLKGPVEGY